MEHLVHGAGHAHHIGHEGIAFFIAQLEQVVHMIIVSYEAAAVVCLLLEQEYTGYTKGGNLNHQIVQGLVVGAI